MVLADAVYPAQALAIGGEVEVDAVKNAGVCRCQGDAGTGGVDLADEDRGLRVGLELLDDVSAILFFDVAVDGHGFHSGGAECLSAQGLDLVNLWDEPGEYYQLLFALDHVVLEDVLQGVQLPPTDQLRLDGVILHQEAAGELL